MDQEPANRILEHALSAGPRCGSVILIGVDGRSGAGKTTLAARISALAQAKGLRTATVHIDEVCPGWDGLPQVPDRLVNLVRQLAAGGSATYPTWDWAGDRPGAPGHIADVDVLIIEGVAATDPRLSQHASVTVWVDGPAWQRKARAIARDGETFARHWDRWAKAEDDYFEARPTAETTDFAINMRDLDAN